MRNCVAPVISPVATLVLSVLIERPMHPYEALSTLHRRRDDRLVRLSPGAVYHAIERLERDGLVREVGVDRGGNRPERTTYEITDEGRAVHRSRTLDLVEDTSREYPRFPVGLALLHDLSLEEAVASLTARRKALSATVEEGRTSITGALDRGLPRRYVLDVLYEIHQADSERRWIDELLRDVADGSLSWTEMPPPEFRPTVRPAIDGATTLGPAPDTATTTVQETS